MRLKTIKSSVKVDQISMPSPSFIRFRNAVVLCVAVVSILAGCEPETMPVVVMPPIGNGSSPGTNSGDDLSLRVEDISFPGIPSQNIRIDHTNREIVVQVPAVFSSDNMTPTLKLSANAGIWNLNELKSPALWCSCCTHNLTIALYRANDADKLVRNRYTIRPVAAGPLSLATDKPIQVAIGDSGYLTIPARNLYGNQFPFARAILTNETTGEQHIVDGIQERWRISCAYAKANHLAILLSGQKLQPGTFHVDLIDESGKLLLARQPVIVWAGRSILTDISPGFSYRAGASDVLTVNGQNLFAGSTSFRLVSATGTSQPLIVVEQSIYGDRAKVQLPPMLKPGYYGIELVQNGQPMGVIYRVSILSQPGQPSVGMVNYKPLFELPFTEPLVVERARKISIGIGADYSPLAGQREFVIKLVNEADPAQTYSLAMQYPIEAYPYVMLPETIAAGHYRLTLLIVERASKAVISESEPFERLLEVK